MGLVMCVGMAATEDPHAFTVTRSCTHAPALLHCFSCHKLSYTFRPNGGIRQRFMVPIFEQGRGRGIGHCLSSFQSRFDDICREQLRLRRAKAFAFIFYNFEDIEIRKILKDQGVFAQLDRLSGNDLSIFYLHSGTRETVEYFNTHFLSKLGVAGKAVPPCVVFFTLRNDKVEDVAVAQLDSADLLHGFQELYGVIVSYIGAGTKYLSSQTQFLRWIRSGITSIRKADLQVAVKESEREEPHAVFGMSPTSVLRGAIQAVPELKYALAVLGLVAVVAIVAAWKISFAVAVFGAVIILVLMVAVLVFAKLTLVSSKHFLRPALFLMWAFVLLTVATGVALFTAATFKAPAALYELIFSKPPQQGINAVPGVEKTFSKESGRPTFTGVVFCKGRRIVLEGNPQAWVRIDLGRGTAEYNHGPPPDPLPPFEQSYEVANTFGNIVIP